MVMSLKRLIAIARKWQKIAGIGKIGTISLPGMSHGRVPHKGHFVVYSADKRRFVVPLTYLNCTVFRELLRMSEEEFGLPKDGPITLPCDSASMEYIVSAVKREVSNDLEMALVLSILAFTHCSSSSTCFPVRERITHCPITVHRFC